MVTEEVFDLVRNYAAEIRIIQLKSGQKIGASVLRDNLPPALIEKIRDADEAFRRIEGDPVVANFLPDDERPADVPALAKRNAENVGKSSKGRTVFSAFWRFLRGANRRTV